MTAPRPIDPERALAVTRLAAGISTSVLLALAALTELLDTATRLENLAAPMGLVGLVSPAIGRHLYELLRQQIAPEAEIATRAAVFVRANMASLAVTGAVALLGIVVFVLSGRIVALTGVLMHVILMGALWPTPERLDCFLDGPQ